MSPSQERAADADLGSAARVLVHLVRVLEKDCEEVGLTLSQYRLLSMIDASPQRAGRLAERAAVSPPAVTAALDALEERGLVARRRDPEDRRAVALRLTRDGAAALRASDRAMGRTLTRLVPPESQADLVDDLLAVGAAMEEFFAVATPAGRR